MSSARTLTEFPSAARLDWCANGNEPAPPGVTAIASFRLVLRTMSYGLRREAPPFSWRPLPFLLQKAPARQGFNARKWPPHSQVSMARSHSPLEGADLRNSATGSNGKNIRGPDLFQMLAVVSPFGALS